MAELKNTAVEDTGAILLPVGTTSQRPQNPLSGHIRYNTTFNTLETYGNRTWKYIPDIVRDNIILNLDAGEPNSSPGDTNTWKDLSGNGYDGVLTNGATYSSINGGSVVFDGVDDYIDLPSSFALGTSTFSIECWVRANTLSGIDAIYYSQSSNVSGFYGVGHNSTSGGFFLSDFNGTTRVTTYFGSNAVVNTWYHLVFLKNSSNQYIVFRNTIASSTNNTSTLSLTSADPRIGINPASSAEIWDGNIVNFRIYNRALTEVEIQKNFNALKGRFGLT